MTLFHSTSSAFTAHIGLCLTDSTRAVYGTRRYEVELTLSGLTVRRVEVSTQDRDDNNWPGDTTTSLKALAADEIDVVVYADEDDQGRQHNTYRLVTAAAVAAVASFSDVTEDDE